jgi:hypothetical protein
MARFTFDPHEAVSIPVGFLPSFPYANSTRQHSRCQQRNAEQNKTSQFCSTALLDSFLGSSINYPIISLSGESRPVSGDEIFPFIVPPFSLFFVCDQSLHNNVVK